MWNELYKLANDGKDLRDKVKLFVAKYIDVKSEIVVPLFLNNIIMGQIDIDSNFPSAFNSHDELFLIEINSLVSKLLEENF